MDKNKLREILSNAPSEILEKIKDIVNSKDDEKLQSYLNTLLKEYDSNKIESSVKYKKPKTIKITAGDKVLSYFNISDYDWVRYKGKITKNIPYAGMILKLEPDDIYGIARVVDGYGKYKAIFPTYKKQFITLDKDIVDLIKNRSNPFQGNVALIFKSTAERKPEIIQAAPAYDFNALKDAINNFVDGHNLYVESIKKFEDIKVPSNEQSSTLKSLKSDQKIYFRNITKYLNSKIDELKTFKDRNKISDEDYKKAISIVTKALDSAIKNPTSEIKNV